MTDSFVHQWVSRGTHRVSIRARGAKRSKGTLEAFLNAETMISAKLSAARALVCAVPIGPRGTGTASASTNLPTYNNGPSKRGKVSASNLIECVRNLIWTTSSAPWGERPADPSWAQLAQAEEPRGDRVPRAVVGILSPEF
jgi:hypothetical protein